MTAQSKCPQCDSKPTINTEEATSSIPFGQVKWQQTLLHCPSCGHTHPLETDDSILAVAIESARAVSVQNMLVSLQEHGISLPQLERAFALAPGTAHQWQDGNLSASDLALIRTVATYPWLVELAGLNFDTEVAESALLQASETLLMKHGISRDSTQT